jgi:hypothetical protein
MHPKLFNRISGIRSRGFDFGGNREAPSLVISSLSKEGPRMSHEAIIAALLALAAYATATQNTPLKTGEVKSGTQRG